MLVRLAWRNVLRNRRRTILAGTAVGIGLAALIFINALLSGMLTGMVKSATDSFMGEGQIHREGFRDTLEQTLTVSDPQGAMDSLSGEPSVTGYAPRTVSNGILTSASDVSSVVIYGIEPGRELGVSRLSEAVVSGEYLGPGQERRILIGSRAADALDVVPGDRLVVTVAEAASGALRQEVFRVAGTFSFGVREADSSLAFIHIERAREMLGLPGGAHEIAIRFVDVNAAGRREDPFWGRYSVGGNEALGWKDLLPQLESVVDMSGFSTLLSTLLIFCVVALTIMNTLFMSLYERMFEFGMLRALGTRPPRMAAIILLEAACLSAISIVIGSAVGLAVTWYYSVHGIDYTGIEFADVTFTDFIYPEIRARQFTAFPALIMLFSLVAGLYPAVFAARLRPAAAMKRSM